MENTIEVVIKPKHFKNATEYVDNNRCPLALAIKEQLNLKDISICSDTVYDDERGGRRIYSFYWGMEGTAAGSLGYNEDKTAVTVNDLIKRAKQKKKVGSYTVVLTKIN